MKYRTEYDLKVIGDNLRRLRLAKSLSVEQVREYLRLGSVQAVYKYEQGKGYPQTDTMLALMELYDVNVRDIVCRHEFNVWCVREKIEYKVFDFYVTNLDSYMECYKKSENTGTNRIKRYYRFMQKGIAG